LRALILHIVSACTRHAWLVICAATLLWAVAAIYVARHIAIDTDTAKLLSDALPWRHQEKIFDAAFPQRTDLIAVVVDGATPELAEQATAALASRLAEDRGSFRAVWRPDGGPFFDRAGLLFEPIKEVTRTTEQLIAAQPMLGTLAADPTLRGLMRTLELALDGVARGEAPLDSLTRPLATLSNAFDAINAGRTPVLSWQGMLVDRAASARELRRFILVQPALDYGALEPGARSIDAIRRAVTELTPTDASRLRVRLTGPVPLADEEFSTLAEGAALNATLTLLAVIGLLAWALRSWRLVIAVLVSLSAGLTVTAAWGLMAFGAFNLISVAFAILFVGLGVDFGIQYCIAFRARRFAGADTEIALREAAGDVGVALALAAASTGAAFFAFLPTAYRGVSELGVIAGTGMIVAFVSTITLLPALLVVLRPPAVRTAVGSQALAPLDRFVTGHRW